MKWLVSDMEDNVNVFGSDDYEEIQKIYWNMTQGWSYIKRRDEEED
jgi:hypothetical protein